MPSGKYIRVGVDDQELEISSAEALPISLSYKLEDPDNFQKKTASQSFDVVAPASPNNDQVANTFHNPAVEDMTPNNTFRSIRRGYIEANSIELLNGKAFLKSARHNSRPLDYSWDFYGNNGDWLIDLQDTTLFDILKHIQFTFTKQHIIDSWAFDGTSESLPYVYAPVRYREPMAARKVFDAPVGPDDYNMLPEYMKPSISKYWIIFWALKSLGYKINSEFFDSPYFRRQLMPWTWGNFLFSEGTRLNNLDFLAKSTETVSMLNQDFTGFWDVKAANDSTNGAFDNNEVYAYNPVTKECTWTYNPAFNYGSLEGTFHFNMFVEAVVTANSDVELRVQWFHNGIRIPNGNDNGNGTLLMEMNAPTVGRKDFIGSVDDWFSRVVDPGDTITAKIYLHTFDSGTGIARIHASVDAFELDYFRIPLGGIINFENYTAFKKYKFLDFLRGVVDEFNISMNTDAINKVVTFEPTHPYSLSNDLSARTGGYFNNDFLDWSEKQDLSKISNQSLFNDSERELLFKYKNDSSDGILKVVQDRYVNTLAMGKYVLPDRFQKGKREVENRFFSPVMHYAVEQWKGLGSDPDASPQMIVMVPENISNTSKEEAQNTFEPKSVYYKGLIDTVGWSFDGEEQSDFPFMFAVNYTPGGEDDPILSYSDERIGQDPDYVVGKGLLKRFYWQRLAIMRNGQYYNTPFKLNNIDITNWLHREHIICVGQRWELVEIKDYRPLAEETTECFLRKWSPISEKDYDATFPTEDNVLDVTRPTGQFDIQYSPLKCLASDIPL